MKKKVSVWSKTGFDDISPHIMPLLLAAVVAMAAWTLKTVIDLQIATNELTATVTHIVKKVNRITNTAD